MFREPSSTEASKSSILKDPSAAARSSIRRQPSVRRPSRYTDGTLRGTSQRFGRPPFPTRTNIGQLLAREATALGFPFASPLEDDPFNLTGDSTDASRREAGQRLLADAARHERPGQRLSLRMLTEALDRPDAPPGQQTSDQLPYTPRFAPAIAYHSTLPSHPLQSTRASPLSRSDSPGNGLVPPRVPQLRRAVEQSISDLNRSNSEPVVDGLGDRQRSLSPDDDDHSHDAWETLLTTITPDANLPSNESSFASQSASATNASRSGTALNSTNSSQTHPSLDTTAGNVHMILDPYPDFLNPCDYPTSSDSESDPELDLEGNRQSRRRRGMPRARFLNSLRQSHDHNSTMSSQPPIPTISLSFHDSTSDPDLQQMQAILDRLVRREDIPDNWWSTAGLSRTVGRRLGAGDETPGSDSPDGPPRQVGM